MSKGLIALLIGASAAIALAYVIAMATTQPCPSCGQRISRNASRCRHCGFILT